MIRPRPEPSSQIRPRSRMGVLGIAVLVGLSNGCAGGGDNGPEVVHSVEIRPSETALTAIGEPTELTGVVRNEAGSVITGRGFQWNATPAGIVSLSVNGASATVSAVAEGEATVTATVDGVEGTAVVSVDQVPVQLEFTVDPANALAEAPFGTQPSVEIQDANSNRVADDNSTVVTVALGTNPAGGTLSGTTAVAAEAGLVQFTDLTIDAASDGYRLTASAPGLLEATSASFEVMVNIESIEVTPQALNFVALGQVDTLSAQAHSPSGAEIPGVEFSWSVSDTNVATVSPQDPSKQATVTAVQNGEVDILASAMGVESNPVQVTVAQEPDAIVIAPRFAVLGISEVRTLHVSVLDALGNEIESPALDLVSRDLTVASVSDLQVTAERSGVTDIIATSGSARDSTRIAVVKVGGFATLLSTSANSAWVTAVPGTTLTLKLIMIRPGGGDGEIASLQGSVDWDPNRLRYEGSTVAEAGWNWVPNEDDTDAGDLSFGAFSASGTAATFILAQLDFTVLATGAELATINIEVKAAGDSEGSDITDSIEPVPSAVRIESESGA